MDNRNTEQLAVPLEKEQESGRYGSVLNVLKISAICFLLDDDLTVLEASNSFYEKTGYSKKSFRLVSKRCEDTTGSTRRIGKL